MNRKTKVDPTDKRVTQVLNRLRGSRFYVERKNREIGDWLAQILQVLLSTAEASDMMWNKAITAAAKAQCLGCRRDIPFSGSRGVLFQYHVDAYGHCSAWAIRKLIRKDKP